MRRFPSVAAIVLPTFLVLSVALPTLIQVSNGEGGPGVGRSRALSLKAPAGNLPASRTINVGGITGVVLPNGRLITPVGAELSTLAPKPYGMALSPDGNTLATVNSGISPFSITLFKNIRSANPSVALIPISSSFMGIVFSQDGSLFYAGGGENGIVWVGSVEDAKIIGAVNLNGAAHTITTPWTVSSNPTPRFKGAFPGNLALSGDGKVLYAVDQAGFHLHVIDTMKIVTGTNASNQITEANNFAAIVGHVDTGRYPYGVATRSDGRLFVTNVGIFEYTHLRPAMPTGSSNVDYPLGYPAAGYPEETEQAKTIRIKKVDPRNLPSTLRDPDGIRVGYISSDRDYTVPGLGSPNALESSSVYIYSGATPLPALEDRVKTGPQVGDVEKGLAAYSGSHPNAIAVGPEAIYVSNGNNDSISVLDPKSFQELDRVDLSVFSGNDSRLKGIQPVALALSPSADYLYVAEAGINAVAVVRLHGKAKVEGHIPVGWWPAAVQVSNDGKTLYVSNARGRGAGPNNNMPPNNLGSPKSSTIGTVNIISVPGTAQLASYTYRVLANNGFIESTATLDPSNPIPTKAGVPSNKIKHIIFINKENSTHDQLLGDITMTRKGIPVNGEPSYSLGLDASPNHHELALRFAFGDNFYLEPAVSSDGHRWLTGMYTTEFEDTHWPASYGGQRNDAGDDPNVFASYPGRLGFTDANGSPDPQDYNEHGGIYLHLARHRVPFINFGNGYEFAEVDEDFGTEPTGIREHVNVPMEKVVRDNSDHLFPNYNTHIPDAPLPEDPTRFNRFGRFKQVFEAHYVDSLNKVCKLPAYVDLFYPNDHGGGARDINPGGPDWSYKRFVQDNDDALGLTVELISNSPCWKDTVIFVVEDDPQNGFDHVDGYRSIFLAISPWVKHEYVAKTHFSLASIFKTVNLILGLPPLNQYDAAATDLRDMFTGKPDFTPYSKQQILYAKGARPVWIALTKEIDFRRPDADEVKLRQAIAMSEGIPRRK
jgi:DNA-binding beta-propeller fold protein YncE